MIELTLPTGQVALLDIDDMVAVESFAWHAVPKGRTCYVGSTVGPRTSRTTLMLHRLLVSAPPDRLVDHRNRNGLDNRRSNLRLCTPVQNRANAISRNSSGYRGIFWDPDNKNWRARITHLGQKRSLGRFADPWLAAQAYNVAALEHWGEFAALNERISA